MTKLLLVFLLSDPVPYADIINGYLRLNAPLPLYHGTSVDLGGLPQYTCQRSIVFFHPCLSVLALPSRRFSLAPRFLQIIGLTTTKNVVIILSSGTPGVPVTIL